MTKNRCNLFRAVENTSSKPNRIRRQETIGEVARNVRWMLEQQNLDTLERKQEGKYSDKRNKP